MSAGGTGLWQRVLRVGFDHPVSCVVLLATLSVIAGIGWLRLQFDVGADRLMVRQTLERQIQLDIAREFGLDARTFVYLRDEQLWTPGKLQALEQLHRELRQLPFVERIDDVFTSPTVRSVDGQLVAQPLVAGAPADERGAEKVRADVLDDPLAQRGLVGRDGKSLAIVLTLREETAGETRLLVHEALEKVLAASRARLPGLAQVGPPAVEAETLQAVRHDFALLTPLSALAMVLVAFGVCGNALAALMALGTGAASLFWTLGLMGWAGIPVSQLSVLLPTLLVGWGAADMVRLALRIRTQPLGATRSVWDRDLRIASSGGHLGGVVPLAALLLALGLSALAAAEIEVLREAGFAVAFGLIANLVLTVLILPLFMRSFHGPAAPMAPPASLRGLAALAVGAVGWARHRLAMGALLLIAVLGAAAVYLSPGLRTVNDPLRFLPDAVGIGRVAERLHEDIAGAGVLYVTLDANNAGAFRDPVNLSRLAEIQAFINRQQVFDASLSLADIVAQAHREASGGRAASYQVPPTRGLVGQYLLLHQPQDLAPYISHDYRRANIVVRHNIRDASTLNRRVRELQLAVARHAGSGMTTAVVGEGVLVDAAADRLGRTTVGVAALMLGLATFLVAAMFTSAKGGLIALLSGLISLATLAGAMCVAGTPLHMGTAMVLLVGIAASVHGTVSLFARYSDLCRTTADYGEAVTATVRGEAGPIIAGNLTLAAALAALGASESALVADFGSMGSLAMLVAALINFLVVPLLMSRIRLVGLYEILAMSMEREALENCALFVGLSGYQIRKTILLSELREVREGDYLIRQGTTGRSMYLVVTGQVEVVRHDERGAHLLARLGPGDVFGEIGYVHETVRTADARAVGPVSVLQFDHDKLRKDLLLFPRIMAKLNFNIGGILGRRLAEVAGAGQAPAPERTAATRQP